MRTGHASNFRHLVRSDEDTILYGQGAFWLMRTQNKTSSRTRIGAHSHPNVAIFPESGLVTGNAWIQPIKDNLEAIERHNSFFIGLNQKNILEATAFIDMPMSATDIQSCQGQVWEMYGASAAERGSYSSGCYRHFLLTTASCKGASADCKEHLGPHGPAILSARDLLPNENHFLSLRMAVAQRSHSTQQLRSVERT